MRSIAATQTQDNRVIVWQDQDGDIFMNRYNGPTDSWMGALNLNTTPKAVLDTPLALLTFASDDILVCGAIWSPFVKIRNVD